MANINLISTRRAEYLRQAKITRGLLAATFASAGVCGIVVVVMLARIFSTAVAIEKANQELGQLRPVVERIHALETERGVLIPKLSTLDDAQQATLRWHGILTGLQRCIPGETWLTNFAVEAREDQQTLRLNGFTTSQQLVGEAMLRLQQDQEHYSGVDLRYTQSSQVGNQSAVEFELAAHLAGPRQGEVEGKSDAKTP